MAHAAWGSSWAGTPGARISARQAAEARIDRGWIIGAPESRSVPRSGGITASQGVPVGSDERDLDQFVRDALARGAARPEIEKALLDAGWSAARARSALAGFAEVPFVV